MLNISCQRAKLEVTNAWFPPSRNVRRPNVRNVRSAARVSRSYVKKAVLSQR